MDIHSVTSFAPMNNAAANGLEREAFFLVTDSWEWMAVFDAFIGNARFFLRVVVVVYMSAHIPVRNRCDPLSI